MKIACNHCGEPNELGRIFCTSCGKRMELSSPMIEDALEKRRIQLNVRMFWPPVLFVVAALAVLAIWPRPPIAPETKGEESGTFQAKVDGLVAAVKAGGSAQAEFVNAELNGYLRSVAKQQKLASAGALIQPGSVTIRVIDQLGPLQVGNRAFGPMRVSFDLVARGAPPCVSSVRVGHLPLPGPFKELVVKQLGPKLLSGLRDKGILAHIRDMKADDGKVTVTVQK